MKRWIAGEPMNAWNMPEHLDVIVDAAGNEWKVRMEGGYTLIGKGGRVHETVNNRMPFQEMIGWWYREHSKPVREAVMRSSDMCAVTCKFCGRADTLEAFTSAPVTGALPLSVFQCPACKRSIERSGDGKLSEIGGAL